MGIDTAHFIETVGLILSIKIKGEKIMANKLSPPKRKIAAPPARTATGLHTKIHKKAFKISPWDASNEGEKIIIYADTGMGKTTLAALSPNPVFIGLDDGGRRIKHPVTGEPLQHIESVESYEDIRNVLQQIDVFDNSTTIVIDTVTILQDLAIPYMLATIPKENGDKATNIVAYGYNKGYQHLYDLMKFILQDCDALVRTGKNVILIAQATPNRISNPGGEDYLRDGPRLYAGKPSTEALYCEWADHILRIDYQNVWVKEKKVVGDTTRVIFTKPELYFRAKSRTVDEPVISFENQQDDSIWKFIFGGK